MYLGQLFEFTCELTKNHRAAQNIPIFPKLTHFWAGRPSAKVTWDLETIQTSYRITIL